MLNLSNWSVPPTHTVGKNRHPQQVNYRSLFDPNLHTLLPKQTTSMWWLCLLWRSSRQKRTPEHHLQAVTQADLKRPTTPCFSLSTTRRVCKGPQFCFQGGLIIGKADVCYSDCWLPLRNLNRTLCNMETSRPVAPPPPTVCPLEVKTAYDPISRSFIL